MGIISFFERLVGYGEATHEDDTHPCDRGEMKDVTVGYIGEDDDGLYVEEIQNT